MKNRYIISICTLFLITTCVSMSASQEVLDADIIITLGEQVFINQCAEDVDKKNFSSEVIKQSGIELEKTSRIKEPWYRALENFYFFMTRAPLPLPIYESYVLC